MKVEIDQSVRVDEPGATFLAFANHVTYAIKVPSKVKDVGREILRAKSTSRKLVNPLLWAACVFLLLRDHLGGMVKKVDKIILDNEFEGHEKNIRGALLAHIRVHYGGFPEDKIQIGYIGKKSPAHKKALAAKRGKRDKADRTVTLNELIKLLAA